MRTEHEPMMGSSPTPSPTRPKFIKWSHFQPRRLAPAPLLPNKKKKRKGKEESEKRRSTTQPLPLVYVTIESAHEMFTSTCNTPKKII